MNGCLQAGNPGCVEGVMAEYGMAIGTFANNKKRAFIDSRPVREGRKVVGGGGAVGWVHSCELGKGVARPR